ncbi:hypothetical protein BS17DRAFT_763896 [Gyrodon lividus]|nr:hypothetical protein BS17DRAFT_763896 [Gyrodon lividus]
MAMPSARGLYQARASARCDLVQEKMATIYVPIVGSPKSRNKERETTSKHSLSYFQWNERHHVRGTSNGWDPKTIAQGTIYRDYTKYYKWDVNSSSYILGITWHHLAECPDTSQIHTLPLVTEAVPGEAMQVGTATVGSEGADEAVACGGGEVVAGVLFADGIGDGLPELFDESSSKGGKVKVHFRGRLVVGLVNAEDGGGRGIDKCARSQEASGKPQFV